MFASKAFSQEQTQNSFSLQQAIEYAKQNNVMVKNSKIDLEIAKKKIWETTAMGLPQVNGKVSGSYMLTIPPTLEMFTSFGDYFGDIYGMIGQLAGASGNMAVLSKLDSLSKASADEEPTTIDDMRWGLTADVTVSQLIFSGAYLVGLQSAKSYKEISELSISKSENDIIEAVTTCYISAIVLNESKTFLDSTYQVLNKSLSQMVEMNKQGFIEESDVDQLKINVMNVGNALESTKRKSEVIKYTLKFLMGYPMDNTIELTENVNNLVNTAEILGVLNNDFSIDNNIDYRLLLGQRKMAELNVKYQKSTFLPDVAAFYQHEENFNDKSFSFTPPNIIGIGVNIPIFGSGIKLARVKQAQLGLQKVDNAINQVSASIQTSYNDTKAALQTAYSQYLTNIENVKLSKRIYNKNIIKFNEGVIGSSELTLSQNQYLQSQTAYYSSIIQLQQLNAQLKKLLNK